MFCKKCGVELDPNAAVCVKCGTMRGEGTGFCGNCGKPLQPGAAFCMKCGASQGGSVQEQNRDPFDRLERAVRSSRNEDSPQVFSGSAPSPVEVNQTSSVEPLSWTAEQHVPNYQTCDAANPAGSASSFAVESQPMRHMEYCKNCGRPIDPQAAICISCGYRKGEGSNYCHHCGNPVQPGAAVCMKCGFALTGSNAGGGDGKSRLVAGLLGVLLGGLGVHRFYLGYTLIGVIQILVTLVTLGIGGLWGLVEGVLILTGNVITRDVKGKPLVQDVGSSSRSTL